MRYSQKRTEMGEENWAAYQKERRNKKVKNWQSRNKQVFVERASEARRVRKIKLVEYKGGKCEICGYNKPVPAAYEFHHPDPSVKEYGIANKNYGLERMKIEVDKCQLLCGNCHAEVHHARQM